MTKRFCQALDLVMDAALISEYERWHKRIPPAVARNIRGSGVENMQIWRIGNRLFMIMDVSDAYDPEEAARLDRQNPAVAAWEDFMWKYQVPTPWTPKGDKWVMMEEIFNLEEQQEESHEEQSCGL